jgi:hypothetical protein
MSTSRSETMIQRMLRPDVLSVLALAAAAGLRVWGAWAMRCITEPDPAVVALMARHMAALKEFPVFFYGQAYMGSLEPMASALMVGLLGSSGFAVNLGPVLFSLAALAALWRWARAVAGPWGGLAAVLAGLTGPSVYFQFQMAPRGGYMVALFVQALALVSAAGLAARLRAGERVGAGRFLALGLLAGIGAWSNLIVAPALAAAALLLAHGMRGRLLRHAGSIAAGLAGVAAGLLPWLAYNVRHGWVSLDMAQTGAREPLRQAVRSSWARFVLLHDDGRTWAGLPTGAWLAAALIALAGLGAWALWTQRRQTTARAGYAGAGAALFVALFIGVFVTSGFTRTPSARYWVPVVPGLAVLAAAACALPGSRARRAAAWTLAGLLAAANLALSVNALRPQAARAPACQAAFRELDEALASTGADAFFAPLQLYALNFANGERIPVSCGKQRFYEPILRGAELAAAPAYSSDFNGIETLLRQRGAKWNTLTAAGRHILWNVRFPDERLAEIPRDATAHLRDAAGGDWHEVLADRNLDTSWSPGTGPEAALEWTFREPQAVAAVHFLFAHGMADEAHEFPRRLNIEVQTGGQWRTVRKDDPIIPLEVSGPGVYFPSGLARLEVRIDRAGVEALRVAFRDTRAQAGRVGWRLAEATLYSAQAGESVLPDADPVAVAAAWIAQAGGNARIYAPRWLSNRLLRDGVAPRERLPGLAPRVFDVPPGMPCDGAVHAGESAVFLVEPRFAAATRSVIEAHVRAYRETNTGAWAGFAIDAGDWDPDGLGLPLAVRWTGDALLTGHTAARAGEALRRLRAGEESEDSERALLDEVVRWRPSALSALPEEQVRRLGGATAVELRRRAAVLPERDCATEFANGLRLEGVAVEPGEVAAGGEVVVRLHWSAGERFEPGQELVFLHWRDAAGKIVAQDDYRGSPLLWGDSSVRPLSGEIVAESRRIRIPASVPPGPLDLAIGLYAPRNGRRVPVRASDAPVLRRHAAIWPGVLHLAD